MKGIIFTEFIDMVEQQFGYELVDELLTETYLPSGGAYTAIGTYSHQEMVDLLQGLNRKTNISQSKLMYSFGQHLFKSLVRTYGHFMNYTSSAFTFLETVDSHIHAEVRKLYPDAELPSFNTRKLSDNQLEMIYKSDRAMGDLAEGLIVSCLEFYNEKAKVERTPLSSNGKEERFLITKI